MKNLFLIVVLTLITGCTSSLNVLLELDQNYYGDLASENNRIPGDLYLDVFDYDLSKLTYDFYLTYITKNEARSAKGFSSVVKNADYHYFKSTKEYFILALFYDGQKTIIIDNSNTPFMDSVHTYTESETVPELPLYVNNYLNK